MVQLFILVLLARVAAFLCEAIKLPTLIGEILVGMVIGNTILFDLLYLGTDIEVFSIFAELGVIFLLFAIGLETPFTELKKVGGTAAMVAILGVVFPFAFGYLLIVSFGHPEVEALFIGAAMVATSVGITARVIKDLGKTHTIESRG
ncbi:MAG: cation:proton antiporter, partial [Euryarchaeota archaeon]|nr:cation:proton antiporter [Euryarchaeota archaeon]